MTKEEDLKEEGRIAVDEYIRELGDYIFGEESMVKMFVLGANYADRHPRKGLWDAEKVCKYLENHAGHYITLENDEEGELQSVFYQKGLIEDLRKAMED